MDDIQEEIIWRGLELRWGPDIPDSYCGKKTWREYSRDHPLDFRSVVGKSYCEEEGFYRFLWLCRGFAEESRYVSLCQVRGGTVDEWLDYLLSEYLVNLIDPKKGTPFKYRLFLLTSWAFLENFEKLQHKLFEKFLSQLCPGQNLAKIKEWTMKAVKEESLVLGVRD